MDQMLKELSRDVLIVTEMDGAPNCAATLSAELKCEVNVAPAKRAALVALRKHDFGVVVVDERLSQQDPEWADQVWQEAGLAMPLEMNFAISGCARLSREIRGALHRRRGEQTLARRFVAQEMESELKTSVTGLLLESELALQEPGVTAALEPKLRHLVELAGELRERLRRQAA